MNKKALSAIISLLICLPFTLVDYNEMDRTGTTGMHTDPDVAAQKYTAAKSTETTTAAKTTTAVTASEQPVPTAKKKVLHKTTTTKQVSKTTRPKQSKVSWRPMPNYQ